VSTVCAFKQNKVKDTSTISKRTKHYFSNLPVGTVHFFL